MTTTDTPSVRVDETLARFRDLQTQFERVRDRLRRAEEQKSTVSRRTFDKVRAEYDRELDALRAKMTPLREELESHRVSVEGGLKDANASLESLEEELAEAVFRNKVGEYTDAELTERRAAIDARLEAARARIASQRHTLDLFDAMQASESASSTPENSTDNAAVPTQREAAPDTPRDTPREAVHEEVTTNARGPVAPAASPRASLPRRYETQGGPKEEPVPSRRPTLSVKNLDGSPSGAPAEPAAPKTDARANAKATADAAFENPHDWIKEMGRDATPPRRGPAASDASRPRLATPAPGTSAPSKSPRPAGKSMPSLVFVNGAHAGESIPLLPTTLTIGREHDNNIELKDPDVARYHARIVHERGRYVVEDLDSTTGTWVNGQRAKKTPLNNGDVVRVGSTEIAIDFEWASDPV
jgi:hypothetical protein